MVVKEKSSVFGTEVAQYRAMLRIGVVIFTAGLFFIIVSYFLFSGVAESIFNMIGYLSFFIGLILMGHGYLGVRDELKKMGQRKKYTLFGKISIFFGGFSATIAAFPVIAVPLGVVAIIVGYVGLKRGDNTYATAGLIAGIIGVVAGSLIEAIFLITGISDALIYR